MCGRVFGRALSESCDGVYTAEIIHMDATRGGSDEDRIMKHPYYKLKKGPETFSPLRVTDETRG